MKEKVLSIEKTPKQKTPTVTNEDVASAKQAYDDFVTSLNNKVYLIAGGKKTGKALMTFLENDAEWSAHEALGIVRAYDDIESGMEKKGKSKLFLSPLCIEAIAYYISKANGRGLASAKKYKDTIFMPINEAMQRFNEDKKQLEELQETWNLAVQANTHNVNIENLTDAD
jgi:hypothetical protein